MYVAERWDAMLTSSAFVTWILHNQPLFVNQHGVKHGLCDRCTPSPSGLLLRRPGSSLSLWLTSSTFPDNGAYWMKGWRDASEASRVVHALTVNSQYQRQPLRSRQRRSGLCGRGSKKKDDPGRNRRTSFSELCTNIGELDKHDVT